MNNSDKSRLDRKMQDIPLDRQTLPIVHGYNSPTIATIQFHQAASKH